MPGSRLRSEFKTSLMALLRTGVPKASDYHCWRGFVPQGEQVPPEGETMNERFFLLTEPRQGV